MKNKKILASLLSLTMIVGSIPSIALAEEIPAGEQQEETEVEIPEEIQRKICLSRTYTRRATSVP